MRIPAIILAYLLLSCESPDQSIDLGLFATESCLPSSASVVFILDDQKRYFLSYEFDYFDEKLIEMKQYEFETNELVFTYTFHYENNKLTKVRKSNWLVSVEYSFIYSDDTRTVINTFVDPASNDTIISEVTYYEPDLSQDGIYFNKYTNAVYEIKNGNVIREGVYQIAASDTTYSFSVINEYDNQENLHLIEPYLFILNHTFLFSIAERLSSNNLLKTSYSDGFEYSPYSELVYDNMGNLRRLRLANDQLYEFEFPCLDQ